MIAQALHLLVVLAYSLSVDAEGPLRDERKRSAVFTKVAKGISFCYYFKPHFTKFTLAATKIKKKGMHINNRERKTIITNYGLLKPNINMYYFYHYFYLYESPF